MLNFVAEVVIGIAKGFKGIGVLIGDLASFILRVGEHSQYGYHESFLMGHLLPFMLYISSWSLFMLAEGNFFVCQAFIWFHNWLYGKEGE